MFSPSQWARPPGALRHPTAPHATPHTPLHPSPPPVSPSPGPTCPQQPTITCDRQPQCTSAGDPTLLVGACSSSNPSATLVYHIGSDAAVTATCPSEGAEVEVAVTPVFAASPFCTYNKTPAFVLRSECRGRQRVGQAGGEVLGHAETRQPALCTVFALCSARLAPA